MFDLLSLPLPVNILLFCALAGVVWVAGTRLSYLGDEIAEKTGIARALIGLLLLAAITSLPELATTITAATKGNAALVLNNMFGGLTMQTAILAIADIVAIHATLTSFPRKPTPILEGSLLIFLLAGILIVVNTGEFAILPGVGLGAIILCVGYMIAVRLLQGYASEDTWRLVQLPDASEAGENHGERRRNGFEKLTIKKLAAWSAGVGVAILISGVLLVYVAETIADQSGLGSSFIGVTIVAATTSLPELSTTIAAIRIRAYTMAISNIFGSNLIMIFLILPADIFYRQGPILADVDRSASFAIISGIAVTSIYCIGLLTRRNKRIFGMGLDSFFVLIVYAFSLVVFYQLR